MSKLIQIWHEIVETGEQQKLGDLLHDDVVFHSPVVHTPQRGKAITSMYLSAAFKVLCNSEFKYTREVIGKNDAVLEFETELNGIYINGIDMITWDDNEKIVDVKVMVRPLKAIQALHQLMAAQLQRQE